jgi:LmbE family N-acetylglucosaminyl deacetylase
MADKTLNALSLLVIGAHPDDCEYRAGGLAALYRSRGAAVKFISVTNGEAGHHREWGPKLVERRRQEAKNATSPLGIECEVWDNPDGQLEVTLERRWQLIRAIRSYQPDLVLTHRPNDYHPDHRAVSLLVQDAAYLLTVPAICHEVPHLRRDPVIAYLADDFRKPTPFDPTVIIDISTVWDQKVAMMDAHISQFYEWLPANMDKFADLPADPAGRKYWMDGILTDQAQKFADGHRAAIIASLGTMVDRIEAFEGCEYGAKLDAEAISRLFPF